MQAAGAADVNAECPSGVVRLAASPSTFLAFSVRTTEAFAQATNPERSGPPGYFIAPPLPAGAVGLGLA